MANGLANPVQDPYERGKAKPRKLELPLEMAQFAEMGTQAIGYKSKWIRHVALPLLLAGRAAEENREGGRQLLKDIKASDWRQAMSEYIEQCEDADES